MWVKSAGCGAAQELADLYRCLIIWPNISSYNQAPGPSPPVQMNEWRVGGSVLCAGQCLEHNGRVRARSGHRETCELSHTMTLDDTSTHKIMSLAHCAPPAQHTMHYVAIL